MFWSGPCTFTHPWLPLQSFHLMLVPDVHLSFSSSSMTHGWYCWDLHNVWGWVRLSLVTVFSNPEKTFCLHSFRPFMGLVLIFFLLLLLLFPLQTLRLREINLTGYIFQSVWTSLPTKNPQMDKDLTNGKHPSPDVILFLIPRKGWLLQGVCSQRWTSDMAKDLCRW